MDMSNRLFIYKNGKYEEIDDLVTMLDLDK